MRPAAADHAAWRAEIRDFLKDALSGRPAARLAGSWMNADPAFSRALAARGWIGLTWPKRYGGQARPAVERFVLMEELLAAGAPVGAHWVADRQIGPMLLRYGTQDQRADILPRIAAGRCFFAIGMSEPGAGSDLASVATRATPVRGGYRVTGTKLWTSNAHIADYIMAVCRTARGEERHAGLSQLLIPADAEGVSIRPVRAQSGAHHFNEVVLDDVLVPAGGLIGTEGDGWAQALVELAHERSGPERFLSTFTLLSEASRLAGRAPGPAAAAGLGRLAAHTLVLRLMSRRVAARLEAGEDAAAEAVVVKDLGADLEQAIPEEVRRFLPVEAAPGGPDGFADTMAETLFHAPSVSLRGGTREILRGIIARDLGLR